MVCLVRNYPNFTSKNIIQHIIILNDVIELVENST